MQMGNNGTDEKERPTPSLNKNERKQRKRQCVRMKVGYKDAEGEGEEARGSANKQNVMNEEVVFNSSTCREELCNR